MRIRVSECCNSIPWNDTNICAECKEKAKFYSGDSDADQRRKNLLLSQDISREMKTAQEQAAALNRASATCQRLFGSKELGQI